MMHQRGSLGLLKKAAWMGATGLLASAVMAQGNAAPAERAPAKAPAAEASAPLPTREPARTWPIVPITQVAKVGSGPIPVILVPGVAGDTTVWASFMERNASRYTMHALTMPGVGESAPPPLPDNEDFSSQPVTKSYAHALIDYIAASGLDKPLIVGHGWGGQVSLLTATWRPDLIRGVVSIDGMPIIPMADGVREVDFNDRKEQLKRSHIRQFAETTQERWNADQYTNMLDLVTDDHRARELGEMVTRTDRSFAFYTYLESVMMDLRPDMQTMRVPALFIAAIPPGGFPVKIQKSLWQKAVGGPPNTTLVFVVDCRHYVMDDAPEALDAYVSLFVNGERIPDSLTTVGTPAVEDPADDANRDLFLPGRTPAQPPK